MKCHFEINSVFGSHFFYELENYIKKTEKESRHANFRQRGDWHGSKSVTADRLRCRLPSLREALDTTEHRSVSQDRAWRGQGREFSRRSTLSGISRRLCNIFRHSIWEEFVHSEDSLESELMLSFNIH